MISNDYNIIYELNRFKQVKTYNDFINVINDVKGLFGNNKLCSNVFDKLLAKPCDYINNIINSLTISEKHIINYIINNIEGDISVYCDANIIEENELINGYYIYSSIDDVKIYTTNEFDYIACILRYINDAYDKSDDILFSSLLDNAMNIIKPSFESSTTNTCIFISNSVMDININENAKVISIFDNKKLSDDVDYKESILNIFTPKRIINIFKHHCLIQLQYGGCKFFNIYEDDNDAYLYNKNNNWLVKEKKEIDICPTSLLVELQLFELKNKQEEEFIKKYNSILQQNRNINFKNTFKHLSINENILYNTQTKTFNIGDLLEPYSQKHRIKHKVYNMLYPYISATTCNNGVADYVNYYMIDSEREVLTICLRKNAPGFASLHKGKFAISSSVGVFVVKNNVKINPYNITFSITKEFSNRHLKNGITIDKLLKSKVKVLMC